MQLRRFGETILASVALLGSGQVAARPKPVAIMAKADTSLATRDADKAAWEKRLAKGFDTLLANATKGIGAMPPKGGADISDADLAHSVAYIYVESGGKL